MEFIINVLKNIYGCIVGHAKTFINTILQAIFKAVNAGGATALEILKTHLRLVPVAA